MNSNLDLSVEIIKLVPLTSADGMVIAIRFLKFGGYGSAESTNSSNY
jgi:hypothetical protein